VFRYNTKLNQFSLIEADYLLSTPHEGKDIYVLIAKNEVSGTYYCRSLFPKEQTDYTKEVKMNSHVSLNSVGVLLVSVRFSYVVFDTAHASL
jgi:hypothetical protein